MNNLGEPLTDHEVRSMIEEADLDGDGRINFQEFARYLLILLEILLQQVDLEEEEKFDNQVSAIPEEHQEKNDKIEKDDSFSHLPKDLQDLVVDLNFVWPLRTHNSY